MLYHIFKRRIKALHCRNNYDGFQTTLVNKDFLLFLFKLKYAIVMTKSLFRCTISSRIFPFPRSERASTAGYFREIKSQFASTALNDSQPTTSPGEGTALCAWLWSPFNIRHQSTSGSKTMQLLHWDDGRMILSQSSGTMTF